MITDHDCLRVYHIYILNQLIYDKKGEKYLNEYIEIHMREGKKQKLA
jgi:hypothetical protein